MIPSPNDNLRIVLFPDPVLHKACAPVEVFNAHLHALAERMLALMHEAKGVGLAAPQVGRLMRLFVCNPTGEPGDNVIFANPKLVELEGAEEAEEGCLSLPGVTVTMRRANRAVIEAFDVNGRPFRMSANNLPARVWQHEFDHLEGRLIIDHMSTSDQIANRRAIKQLENQSRDKR